MKLLAIILFSSTFSYANNTTLLGGDSKADGNEATAVGYNTWAHSDQSTAIGANAGAEGKNATAIGHKSTAIGDNALSLGSGAMAIGEGSLSIGSQAYSEGKDAISIGKGAINNAENGVILGSGSRLSDSAENSVLIGSKSSGTASNAIILGDKSSNNRDNTLSIGSDKNQRQIINVAAGTQDTDAVNVSQLQEEKNNILIEADKRIRDNNVVINDKIEQEKNTLLKATTTQINENNKVIQNDISKASEAVLKQSESKAKVLADDANKKSNQYTDSKINEHQDTIINYINEEKNEFYLYTEDKLSDMKAGVESYTDNKISESEKDIKNYTNNRFIEVENSGKEYTDFKVNQHDVKIVEHIDNVRNEITISTEGQVKASEKSANSYTDIEISKIASGMEGLIGKNNEKIIKEREKYINQKGNEYINITNSIISERDESLKEYIERSKHDSISIANEYTNNKIKNIFIDNDIALKNMDNKIDKADKRASAGIASVAAMANIPYVTAHTFSLGVGVGNYRDANALATGAQYQITESAIIRVSASWNTEDRGVVGGGVSYGW
ncbi:YadA-like family protein [Proteus sp. NMG38-2]|uniref:YadA-like family protein n=1 Tax=Proteus sp. NMG38-2 TaxID=2883107 RepID=UPI001D09F070|nr:YadA-like family protein [Proteus sp. NMG38-2]UDN34661.1 YadA-like family protein [Proteus sp. NMG38-2]